MIQQSFRRFTLASLALLVFTHWLSAQMQLGMRWERRAGIYTTAFNPAFSTYNPHRWDVSLASVDLFGDNDYFYLKNTKAPYVLRQLRTITTAVDIDREQALRDAFEGGYYDRTRSAYGVFASRVGGPSFSIRLGEKHTVGLVTAVRAHGGTYDVPATLRGGVLPQTGPLTIPRGTFGAMTWAEVGAHYSYGTELNNGLFFSVGITPKYLLGHQALLARNFQPAQIEGAPGDTVEVRRLDVLYGFTNDLANTDPNGDLTTPRQLRGRGWGVDVGFSLAQPDEAGDTPDDYKWRLGVSLVDVGNVFFRNNGEVHRLQVERPLLVSENALDNPANLRQAVQQLSQTFLGSPDASLTDQRLGMRLPMVFSVQADYKIVPMVYAGAVLTQGIPGGAALRAPSLLAVAPRFEHQWAALSVPVVVNDWRKVRVGLAARLAFLTIGTDNLGSWVGQSKLSGADFYAGLKINGFRLRQEDNGRVGRSKRRRGGECYSF